MFDILLEQGDGVEVDSEFWIAAASFEV